jgi:cytochrome c oxidase assembly protein subunit 15
VRVTASGLGCPTWPTCDGTHVIPRAGGEHAGWQTAIEFGNRTLTGVVLAAAIAVLWAAYRDRTAPRITRVLGWWLIAGILAQAVLGGITVLLELHPLTVMAHFLLSMVLIAIAVVLHDRTRPPDGAVTPGLRWTTNALVVVAAAVLVLGTLVTAAGPHAGDPGTPRLGLDIRLMAIAHADAVWLLLGLTVAVVLLSHRGAPPRLHRAARVLLIVEVVQGAIGYTQYALGIPAGLVALHILGAAVMWTFAMATWAAAHPRPAGLDLDAEAAAPRAGDTVAASP